jgi:hypothetical protein
MAEPIRSIANTAQIAPRAYRSPRPAPQLRRPAPWPVVKEASRPEPAAGVPAEGPGERLATRRQPLPATVERKLRTALLAALGLHLSALLLPFALPAALPAPSLSDSLLALAVLLAGGAVLAIGALGRRD